MTDRTSGLPRGAWVLVADGEKALFLRNIGDATDMNLEVVKKDTQDNPKAQDWAANRPGRMHDNGPGQKSAVDDTDWHELEKERFAKDLGEYLYKQAHKGAFDDLVIVASRPVLSELRNSLHKEVQDKILFDVAKVLTNQPIDELEKSLAQEIKAA
ncbi:host attachment protein [Tropicibacter naphthalenivorans]|uniref:Protein required for attachment to host cells n=1 Tax=Tropicibacter naphthalenivorans TaxID=441103 RepID=A0A0N7LYS0_9RHOB|nr:host attachment family protein [Tropicibacter naphthalenivorans]CUH75641.1 Protein required for attachment to host cells [Tropicibacter naphthalenivorans]SMC43062.1 Protein required for attachment to host cells [Tropicibacter naphthalenivorans]